MQTRVRQMPAVLAAILSSELVTMTIAKMDGAKIRALGVHLYHAFSNDTHYTELMGLYHSTEVALSLHRRLAGVGIEVADRRLAVCYATEAGLIVDDVQHFLSTYVRQSRLYRHMRPSWMTHRKVRKLQTRIGNVIIAMEKLLAQARVTYDYGVDPMFYGAYRSEEGYGERPSSGRHEPSSVHYNVVNIGSGSVELGG